MASPRHSMASHAKACQLARDGQLGDAREKLQGLLGEAHQNHSSGQLQNNLAAVEASLGQIDLAEQLLQQAVSGNDTLDAARRNIDFLKRNDHSEKRQKVAIVSLLFNWPSTGGGTVHTKELAEFLTRSCYDVRHIYAVNENWDIGGVRAVLPYRSVPIRFSKGEWTPEIIRERFRNAAAEFLPDWVIITDSWNTKPLLAEAVAEFPYFIRIAAQESICPLNNVRLLIDDNGQLKQCDRNQLDDPRGCKDCVSANQHRSGGLHQVERELAGFRNDGYAERLQKAFASAEGILVVNPTIAELVRRHAQSVHVVPSGFDARRFPLSLTTPPPERSRKRILFAGLTQELMKGFAVLAEAGEKLWRVRQDFEIVATDRAHSELHREHECINYVGWQSQQQLPQLISDCDILVFPTIAQEALGRTAVEAMGCGRPVIASDLGGLSWVVEHGINGLLCEPGNPDDLAAKIDQLLDDRERRVEYGINGRKKFEEEFTWDSILQRHYLKLFGPAVPELLEA